MPSHFNGTNGTDGVEGTDGTGVAARYELALARVREARHRSDAALSSAHPAHPGAHDEQPSVHEDTMDGTDDIDGTEIARARLAIARSRRARLDLAQRAALAIERARIARGAKVDGDREPEWLTETETVLHGCGRIACSMQPCYWRCPRGILQRRLSGDRQLR